MCVCAIGFGYYLWQDLTLAVDVGEILGDNAQNVALLYAITEIQVKTRAITWVTYISLDVWGVLLPMVTEKNERWCYSNSEIVFDRQPRHAFFCDDGRDGCICFIPIESNIPVRSLVWEQINIFSRQWCLPLCATNTTFLEMYMP